jgi:hypothetical protein
MSVNKVPYGKPVKLLVDYQGYPDGRLVQFEIWRKKGGEEEKVSAVYGVTKGGKGIGWWIPYVDRKGVQSLREKISYKEEKEKYYFVSRIDEKEAKSGDIVLTYPLEVYLEDEEGIPIDEAECTVTFSDGSKEKRLLKNGRAQFKDAPPGKFNIEVEGYSFDSPGKIIKAIWEKKKIKYGDKIKLIADVEDFEDGARAQFTVYEYKGSDERFLVKDGISGQVSQNKVEVEWQFEYDKKADYVEEFSNFEKDYSFPKFIFDIEIKNKLFHCDDQLTCYGGPIFTDEKGNPIENSKAMVYLPDGRIILSKILNGYFTEPYHWKRGNIRVHIFDDIGGIE